MVSSSLEKCTPCSRRSFHILLFCDDTLKDHLPQNDLNILMIVALPWGTVLRQARYCLCIVREIHRWPREYCFNAADLKTIAASWAAGRVAQGRAAAARWPKEQFYSVACSFLKRLGRLAHDPDPPPGRYDAWLEDFLEAEYQGRGLALATRKVRHWHIRRFLFYLDQQGYSLERLTPGHIDAYFPPPRPNVESRCPKLDYGRLASVVSALRDSGKDTGGVGRLNPCSPDLPARGTPLRTDMGAGQRHHSRPKGRQAIPAA